MGYDEQERQQSSFASVKVVLVDSPPPPSHITAVYCRNDDGSREDRRTIKDVFLEKSILGEKGDGGIGGKVAPPTTDNHKANSQPKGEAVMQNILKENAATLEVYKPFATSASNTSSGGYSERCRSSIYCRHGR